MKSAAPFSTAHILCLTGIVSLTLSSGPLAFAETPATPVLLSAGEDSGLGLVFVGTASLSGKTALRSGNTHYGRVCSTDFSATLGQSITLTDSASIEVGLAWHRTEFDLEWLDLFAEMPVIFSSPTR